MMCKAVQLTLGLLCRVLGATEGPPLWPALWIQVSCPIGCLSQSALMFGAAVEVSLFARRLQTLQSA